MLPAPDRRDRRRTRGPIRPEQRRVGPFRSPLSRRDLDTWKPALRIIQVIPDDLDRPFGNVQETDTRGRGSSAPTTIHGARRDRKEGQRLRVEDVGIVGIQNTLVGMGPNHVFEQRTIRDQLAQCTGILGSNTLTLVNSHFELNEVKGSRVIRGGISSPTGNNIQKWIACTAVKAVRPNIRIFELMFVFNF